MIVGDESPYLKEHPKKTDEKDIGITSKNFNYIL